MDVTASLITTDATSLVLLATDEEASSIDEGCSQNTTRILAAILTDA
jgi:hypothetical protein